MLIAKCFFAPCALYSQEELKELVERARKEKGPAFDKTLTTLFLLGDWSKDTCKGVFASLPDADIDEKVRAAFEALAARHVLADELTSKGSMAVANSIYERVVHRFTHVAGLHSTALKPGLPYSHDARESAVVTTWYRTINDLVAFSLKELEESRGKQGDEHPSTGKWMEPTLP